MALYIIIIFFQMIENKKWESLVWIIIWIVLLSFVVLWMANLIWYWDAVNSSFEINSITWLLKDNALSIVQKIDPSWVNTWEDFYIFKDNNTKTFKVMTWITNANYRFINKFWEQASITWYEWNVYERILKIEKVDPVTNSKIYNVSVKQVNKYQN